VTGKAFFSYDTHLVLPSVRDWTCQKRHDHFVDDCCQFIFLKRRERHHRSRTKQVEWQAPQKRRQDGMADLSGGLIAVGGL